MTMCGCFMKWLDNRPTDDLFTSVLRQRKQGQPIISLAHLSGKKWNQYFYYLLLIFLILSNNRNNDNIVLLLYNCWDKHYNNKKIHLKSNSLWQNDVHT